MKSFLVLGLAILGGCVEKPEPGDSDTGVDSDTAVDTETDTGGDSETAETGDTGETDTGETDTGETDTGPHCDEGEIFDGEVCVPEVCGMAPWGNAVLDESTVYVDGTYGYHGDGTEKAPFIHISDALYNAKKFGEKNIVIARSNYREALRLDVAHSGIRLHGRCAELVVIDSHSEPANANGMTADGVLDLEVSGIRFDAAPVRGISIINGAQVTASDLEVTNATTTGIAVMNGSTFSLDGGRFDQNHEIGMLMSDNGTTVTLSNIEITRTQPAADGTGGIGLSAQNGATVTADRVNIQDNQERGVQARGNRTLLYLSQLDVAGTLPNAAGAYGRGMDIESGAVVECMTCSIIDNAEIGVSVDGVASALTMRESEVGGTLLSTAYATPRGIVASTRAEVTLDTVTVARNFGPGLHIASGANVTVTNSTFMEDRFAEVVLEDGTGHFTGCDFTGTVPDGVLAGGVGLYAGGTIVSGRTLTMEESTMSGAVLASVWIDGLGSYHIARSDLEGGPGVLDGAATVNGNAVYATGGVDAWDGTNGLWLEGNTLTNSFIGVLLDLASAELSSNTWRANTFDLVQQSCGTVSDVVYDGSPVTDLCPSAPYPTEPLFFTLTP